MMRRITHAATFTLVAALTLAGCATLHRGEAMDAEQLLAAAGFEQRAADTPERLAHLRQMPPLKIVARDQDGERRYTYADPDTCRCLYVGGAKEYAEYRRLQQ